MVAQTSVTFAAPGDLDPSFGGEGIVTTPVGPSYSFGQGVVVQPDGKVIVAGYAGSPSTRDFAVARYNADGSLDASFDGDGRVLTSVGPGDDIAYTIALQPDGKIVVAGATSMGGDTDFAVVRYNADGSLDPTFGGEGIVTTAVSFFDDDHASSVVVQSDGKLVLAGSAWAGPAFGSIDFAVVRYNADGSLDSTFDGDGKVTTAFGTGTDAAYGVVLQADGKIVVAGYSEGTGGATFAVARYRADGSLDSTFDGDGRVRTPVGPGAAFAFGIVLQPDGKPVVAGVSQNETFTDFDVALARYNADGSVDAAFGNGGTATGSISPFYDFTYAIARQPDGKLAVTGTAYGDNGDDDVFVMRFDPDGSVDPSFGVGGSVLTPIGPGNEQGRAIAVQNDGKIVVAGNSYADNLPYSDFAVVRYLGDATCGNGVVEAGEQCDDGNTAAGDCCAPACEYEPSGNPCSDGEFCNGAETCAAGVCVPGAPPCPLLCDEGVDQCVVGCATTPRSGCRSAGLSLLQLEYDPSDRASDKLVWKWLKGTETVQADWGSSVTICIYAGTGPLQVASAAMPDGPTYWSPIGQTGWRFSAPTTEPDGVRKSVLKGSTTGRAKIRVKGRGDYLPDLNGPLAMPVVVQMVSSASACFESVFPSATRNDGQRFTAKSP